MKHTHIMNPTIKKIGAIAILGALVGVFIAGCNQHTPMDKAWVSVEKAPVKIIYVSDADRITDSTVDLMARHAARFPFRAVQFEPNQSVSGTIAAQKSDDQSTTDSKTITVTGGK